MKKILLISDTHGYLDPRLEKHIQSADEVWHGGDLGTLEIASNISSVKPFKAVCGNIDGPEITTQFASELFFVFENVRVYMIHIGGYPGKYPARVKTKLKELQPDLFICGHSHILKVMHDPEHHLLHINPGACGQQGFHQVKTAVRFELDDGEIKNLAVIELGKRTSLPSQNGSEQLF